AAKIDRGVMIEIGEDILVYLEGEKASEGSRWAEKVIAASKHVDSSVQISAGISCFPYCDFKKSEMVLNCRKALVHASFYGESSVAVFDATSLNISGDVYFGEGDLTKAVREYRRGLKCDDQDINLHNSLGVALAQMNKLSSAMKSFESALAVDKGDFMALYNLGLAEQAIGRPADALKHFKKALDHQETGEVEEGQVSDLKLQIGKLSCEVGMYKQAIDFLVPWSKANSSSKATGRIAYYLGMAYHGVKDNRTAMIFLQQALRVDEFDDRAMNLLGRIYLEEGEGDEIALALVQKSVELEPSSVRYRLYLAMVLLQCGLYDRAKENLYRCLRYKASKGEARLLLAKTYLQEGAYRRAASWFEKVVVDVTAGKKMRAEAERGLAKIQAIKKGDHA
ncbi:MAG: tetratricopeptide repeat protein, partial [Desulforhopalus sp.]